MARTCRRTDEDPQAGACSSLIEEEERFIKHAYRIKGEWGLLIKALFQTGTRVSEFVNIRAEDVFFDEQMIWITKAGGEKSWYVPTVPDLKQELRMHLGKRTLWSISLRRTVQRGTHHDVFSRSSRKQRRRHRSPSGCIRISSGTRWQPRF